MAKPIIYGPSYSTYVRTVRMVFEEKGVEYELKPIDMMGGETRRAEYLGRHPFGKVPSFEHDGFSIYETGAICRYIDRVFPAVPLVPSNAREAARMDQAISIVDSYAYGAIVGKLVWQRLVVPMQGGAADEATVKGCLDTVRLCLAELDRLKGSNTYMASSGVSLADCFLAPVFAYMMATPEAPALLDPHRGLRDWWSAMETRPSVQKTPPQFG